jgi:MFS family permease
MRSQSKITRWLSDTNGLNFSLYCIAAAFITYCSMYAFRKPFTAGTFEDLTLWGIDYKIILITTQVIGYMLSKFIGIKVVSEMGHGSRIRSILALIGISWVALLIFGLVPYPFNFIALFFNGLPLGMIWGIVFSFLEGRRNTELLGAGMATSFIVSSGFVKAVGKVLTDSYGLTEFWMPFAVGAIFVPSLFLGVWMLGKIPPPTPEDKEERTERVPMNRKERRQFFKTFAPGIVLVVTIYIALTIFRDVRDNFAVELWDALGYGEMPSILVTAELPIAATVLILVAAMMFIRSNRLAFYTNLFIIFAGGVLVLLTTWGFQTSWIPPGAWMIIIGFGMYLAYISYHTMLFERWIALFRYRSNIGYLMYVADAFGYLGSVGVLFFKNFGASQLSWLSFFTICAYAMGITTILLSGLAVLYFLKKERNMNRRNA